MFSGEEEGQESEKRERVERGYGPEPRPGRAQSTRCKNANRPPPTRSSTKETREKKKGKQERETARKNISKCCKSETNHSLVLCVQMHEKDCCR